MVVNKKTENTKVDDYYSNIDNNHKNATNNNEKKVVVKRVKIRKKAVIKKVSDEKKNYVKPEEKKELNLEEKLKRRIVSNPENKNSSNNSTTNRKNPNYKGKNPNYKGKNPNSQSSNLKNNNNQQNNKNNFGNNNSGNNNSGNNTSGNKNPNYKGNNASENKNPNYKGNNNSGNNTSGNKNPNYKGNNNSYNKSTDTNKKTYSANKTWYKGNFNRNNNTEKNKTNTNTEGNITERGSKTKWTKTFGTNKYKDNWNKTNFSNRNSGGRNFSNRNSRFNKKVFWKKEEESGFVRAKKTKDVEKKETKIEDIKQQLVDRTGQTIIIDDILSFKEFSEKAGIAIPRLLMEFMRNGMSMNINSKIDFDTACIIWEAFEITFKRNEHSWFRVEDVLGWNLAELLKNENQDDLVERPPIISIMWHVDHGKTSLLDNIRKSKVTSTEAGWITQSIWAYQVEHQGKKITFLDTPGHEAFSIMRARWAKSTDIAILVVAADEWVKPQTIESINHAKEAEIPIIVAINKMDKDWANPDHVKWQLSEKWLTPEDWWGNIPMIPVSAKTWFGLDELLEMILLVSEMENLKANPNRSAIWTVIESHLDKSLWAVATVIINTWTLKKADSIVCKWVYWKVKVLKNFAWVWVKEAYSSDPILLTWLNEVVEWWDLIQVVWDIEAARKKSQEYYEIMRNKKAQSMSNLDVIMSKIKAGSLKSLKVLIKADSNWSLEALKGAISKLSTPETNVTIIHAWVGNVTESDINMAEWSKAILIWFWVWEASTAKKIIIKADVEYINSKIIYHITERIEKIVTWMLDPKEETIILWEAKVWWIFFTWKWFMILWLILQPESKVEVKCQVNVVRKWKLIWKWMVENLKSWMIEIKDIEWPAECWIEFKWDAQVEMKDTLEFYKTIIVK